MLRSYKRKARFYRDVLWGIRLGGHPHANDIEVQGHVARARERRLSEPGVRRPLEIDL